MGIYLDTPLAVPSGTCSASEPSAEFCERFDTALWRGLRRDGRCVESASVAEELILSCVSW